MDDFSEFMRTQQMSGIGLGEPLYEEDTDGEDARRELTGD